jgi:ferredoxin
MISIRYTNAEEVRQMMIHKWIESEKARRDLGEAALMDWITKYAASFRSWVMALPDRCTGCGLCQNKDLPECTNPFHEQRLKQINHDC